MTLSGRALILLALVACLAGCKGEPQADPSAEGEKAPATLPPCADCQHAVVIVIDTLRADVVAEVQTPAIDSLAASGSGVSRAWSAGTWTVPSIVSLFTGMTVRQHGWDLPMARMGRYPTLPDAPTLAEVLETDGYATTGFYANPYLAEDLGFDRGFETWQRIADRTAAAKVRAEIEQHWGDGRRHFIYLHLLGPHSPLKPSVEAAQRWQVDPVWIDPQRGFLGEVAKRNIKPGAREAYASAYRAVVEDTDARVAEILEAIESYRDQTVVVLTSDHGELLGEHDRVGHGKHVWEPLTHVPLVARNAGELPPTLRIAAIPALVTSALRVEHDWPATSTPLVAQREGQLALSPDGKLKGIWTDSLAVYDLADDAGEGKPLAGHDTQLETARREWESTVQESGPLIPSVLLDPAVVKELEALGYVEPKKKP